VSDALHRLKLQAELKESRRGPAPAQMFATPPTRHATGDAMTTALPHRLDRTLVHQGTPTDGLRVLQRFGAMGDLVGAGSTIDPRPGGQVLIRHPNGVEVAGEVVDVSCPQRIVFTYGYVSGTPIPVGSSRVTIRLDPHPQGTLLQLTHEFSEAAHRDPHVQGWRFQLSLFANTVATVVLGDGTDVVDRWFTAWNHGGP
jgi:uncharacterized protein YndB with AHSA1/START domain